MVNGPNITLSNIHQVQSMAGLTGTEPEITRVKRSMGRLLGGISSKKSHPILCLKVNLFKTTIDQSGIVTAKKKLKDFRI